MGKTKDRRAKQHGNEIKTARDYKLNYNEEYEVVSPPCPTRAPRGARRAGRAGGPTPVPAAVPAPVHAPGADVAEPDLALAVIAAPVLALDDIAVPDLALAVIAAPVLALDDIAVPDLALADPAPLIPEGVSDGEESGVSDGEESEGWGSDVVEDEQEDAPDAVLSYKFGDQEAVGE